MGGWVRSSGFACVIAGAPEDKAAPGVAVIKLYVMTKGSLAPVTNHFCPAARTEAPSNNRISAAERG